MSDSSIMAMAKSAREVIDKLEQERDELAAYVERLRQALIDTHAALWVERGLSTIGAKIKAETICPKIDPAQSLTLHDNAVIERCAVACEDNDGYEEYDPCTTFVGIIRALKDE